MITVRPAIKKDLPAIQKLHRALFLYEEKHFDDTVNPKWSLTKHARAWFASQIGVRNECLIVAEVDGKVVGYLSASLLKPLRMWKPARYAELYSISVTKKHQRAGLGKAMMQMFLDWSKRMKIDYISVDASFTNKGAIDFYRKYGFKPHEVRMLKKLA